MYLMFDVEATTFICYYLAFPFLGGSSERAAATRPSQNENKNASSIFQALAVLTSLRQLVSDYATPSVLPCITI